MTLIHETYKSVILTSVIESKSIREKLTFKEQIKLCDHVSTLSKKECEELLSEFGVADFQSKFKSAVKYGLAAIAGGILGASGVGVVVGATVAMFTRYIFRKTTDPCWQACVRSKDSDEQKMCKYNCHVAGCNSVIRDITNQLGKCGQTKNPEQCRTRLEKQKLSWMQKREDYIEKLHNEQDKYTQKAAKQRLKDRLKNKKANEARHHLKSIIIYSDKLKNRTTFQEQLDILNWVWNAPNYKILKIAEAWDDPPPIPPAPVKKALKFGFAVAAVVLPGGLILQQLASYLIDSYNHNCQKSCHERDDIDNKSLCYRQCKYNSYVEITKAINLQYGRCDATKAPNKCRKKLRSLMINYRKKTMEAKMRLDRENRRDKMRR